LTIASFSGRAVLIADHDADTRQMYAEYLRFARFDVDEADEGRGALAKALGRCYDVIITDVRLPGIDGYQLTRVLRRDPSTRRVPILVVSGEGSSSAVDRASKAGADAVLVKPAMPDAVLAEVRRFLETPTPHAADSDSQRQFPVGARRGHIRSRAHQRGETLTPPMQPPELLCPRCDIGLLYRRSYIGGVSAKNSEQWDEYGCPNGCGDFQYRQRTRKIRAC
jgi:two-component system, chemotaxis family, chemotaxis protein CheY